MNNKNQFWKSKVLLLKYCAILMYVEIARGERERDSRGQQAPLKTALFYTRCIFQPRFMNLFQSCLKNIFSQKARKHVPGPSARVEVCKPMVVKLHCHVAVVLRINLVIYCSVCRFAHDVFVMNVYINKLLYFQRNCVTSVE